jgi:hypothetical protein
MTTTSFRRIEIYFWDLIIRILSESRVLRYLIPKIYVLTHSKNIRNFLVAMFFTSAGGFCSGFLIKVVISMSR